MPKRLLSFLATPTMLPVLVCFVVCATLVTYFSTSGVESLLAWPADDAYYYLEIARNWVILGSPTFDGIHATNGFQFLWQLILLPQFAFTHDSITGVRIVLVLQSILWLVSVLALYLLLLRLTRFVCVSLGGVLFFFYPTTIGSLLTGMELTVAVVAVSTFLICLHALWVSPAPTFRLWAVLGMAAIFVVLTRIDLILLPTIAYAALWLRSCRRSTEQRKGVLLSVGILGAALGIYAIANLVAFGLPLPVSGLAKTGFEASNLVNPEPWSNALTFKWSSTLPDYGYWPQFLAIVGGIILSVLAWSKRIKSSPLILLIVLLTVTYVSQILMYHTMLELRDISSWWNVLSYPLITIELAFVLSIISERSQHKVAMLFGGLRGLIFKTGVAAVFIASFLALLMWLFVDPPHAPWYVAAKYKIASDVAALAPGVVAMGDSAGMIGYFSERGIVHLEGLVNDKAYLSYLRNGKIAEYLASVHARYLIAVDVDDDIRSDNYEQHLRREPYREAWTGPVSLITVYRFEEVYRYTDTTSGHTFVIWDLQRAAVP